MAEKPIIKIDLGSPVSIKAEIKAEIPKESAGRLLDTLTDIIRPFTETRGLRADQIRLQREDILIEIARRAKVRAELEGSIRPIGNKFLIPFLEKASLEDPQSELVDKWANLLATAAHGDASEYTWCISLLSELAPSDFGLLDGMHNNRSEQMNGIRFEHLSRAQIQDVFDSLFPSDFSMSFDGIKNYASANFDHCQIFRGDDIPNTNEVLFDLNGLELSLSRLESLGLLWLFAQSTLVRRPEGVNQFERVFVVAAQLTLKGRALVDACKGSSE